MRHAIDRYENYIAFKDFASFNKEQALGFKQALLAHKNHRTDKTLSKATAHHCLQALKEFFAWLQTQPKYRARIKSNDIAYLSLTKGEERQAQAVGQRLFASVADYHKAIFAMPTQNEFDLRDRAVMALILATGMRDQAAISLKLKHINLDKNLVFQDAREVHTKFSKTIETFFFPVGEEVIAIVREWVIFLQQEKNFGDDDPLFPKTINGHNDDKNFTPQALSREPWANATPVRKIFKEAFARVGLPYAAPHSVRHTLTQFAYGLHLNAKQMKAFSQNLGHDSPLTTFTSYGKLTPERQAELIQTLGEKGEESSAHLIDEAMVKQITNIVLAVQKTNAANLPPLRT